MSTERRVAEYIIAWKNRGYQEDIPDEVPDVLMSLGLAPSYKAICYALLKNDLKLEALGFSGGKKSRWYSIFKRIELEERAKLSRPASLP